MNLAALFKKYGSDKYDHGFGDFYERFFGPVREEVKSVLEIGVADGASIRAWLDYFPNAHIYGIDAPRAAVGCYCNVQKWPFTDRTSFGTGDQANRSDLNTIFAAGWPEQFDIVIDDGGHTMEQQQVSLGVLFPHTSMFYVVEDLHTSFMDEITIHEGGKPVRSYPTGIQAGWTTYDMLTTLKEVRPGEPTSWGVVEYMRDDEVDHLLDAGPTVHIFDRDGDHKHMTSVLEAR